MKVSFDRQLLAEARAAGEAVYVIAHRKLDRHRHNEDEEVLLCGRVRSVKGDLIDAFIGLLIDAKSKTKQQALKDAIEAFIQDAGI